MGDSSLPDIQELGRLLRASGALCDPSEAHGAFCGRASLGGAAAIRAWRQATLADTESGNALAAECGRAMEVLAADSLLKLEAGDMRFKLLLPADDESLQLRAAALADWCHGFMHGLVEAGGGDVGPQSDALENPIAAEILDDFSEITKAGAGEHAGEEAEQAFVELVEYVRVSVQIIYDEMAPLRAQQASAKGLH